jgi:hypothetical protein
VHRIESPQAMQIRIGVDAKVRRERLIQGGVFCHVQFSTKRSTGTYLET